MRITTTLTTEDDCLFYAFYVCASTKVQLLLHPHKFINRVTFDDDLIIAGSGFTCMVPEVSLRKHDSGIMMMDDTFHLAIF